MGKRFVDGLVIRQRMDAKDARIAREQKAREQKDADTPHCPRCGSYQWEYRADKQVCGSCGAE